MNDSIKAPIAGPSSKPNFGGDDNNDELNVKIIQRIKEFY